jgi:hypothetical protein
MPSELTAALAGAIDVKRASVRPFDGFVFVCGGKIPSPTETALASIRHFAIEKSSLSGDMLANCRVIVAEQATELLRDGSFSDLLEFEEHLAALAACVLLFVESPGSIAELGSFAVMQHLRTKVLVVCEQVHATDENSFIVLGPVSSLRNRDKHSVQVFPMYRAGTNGVIPDRDLIAECWESIEGALQNFVQRPIRGSDFDASSLPHRLVLLVELVSLFGAMRIGELEDCAREFGCKLSQADVDRALNVLVKFGLVASRRWGHEKFYFAGSDKQLMLFKRSGGNARPFDRLRFVAERVAKYGEIDSAKSKALKAYRREASGK